MNSVTFIIFTYNEEKRIATAIKNFIDHGDVVLMDGGSTDRTQEIAESLGAKFLARPPTTRPFVENQENLDFIKQNIITDYIYWGYADNAAPLKLLGEFNRIAREAKYKKVTVPMWTYLNGDTEHIAHKSHLACFFHKDYINFSKNIIHGFGEFLGTKDQALTLESIPEFTLRHLSVYNEEKFVAGYMRYGKMEAAQKFSSGERFSTIKLLAAMLRYLWIYRRLLSQGRLGIVTMMNQSFGRLITYTALLELQEGVTIEEIQSKFNHFHLEITTRE
jgi:glycosyltransferase involved in cell wall biosynthesis